MPSKREYLHALSKFWPRDGKPPAKQLLKLAERATREHPSSPRFWTVRGDLLKLNKISRDNVSYGAEAFLGCYVMATLQDPQYADAYAELGHTFYLMDNLTVAESCFRKAIKLSPEQPSYYTGLADVLIESGKLTPAISLLNSSPCKHDPQIQKYLSQHSKKSKCI